MNPPRRFALIGLGRIGGDVAAAWNAGELPGWGLVAALVRQPAAARPAALAAAAVAVTTDPGRFLDSAPDLIIECAGPTALAMHGAAALAVAEVWSTSAAALADPEVHDRLHDAALRHGRTLRLLSGAIAGIDGLQAIATDPAATLDLEIDLPPSGEGQAVGTADAAGRSLRAGDDPIAEGSVREIARRYPGQVNVAVVAALAGPGLDRARIRLYAPATPRHRLGFLTRGRTGTLSVDSRPRVDTGRHPVAAAIIGALRDRASPIRLG